MGDVDRGHVGGSGGGKAPLLVCGDPVNERIVGIALEMSNQNTTNGGRSAQAIRIGCARVTLDGSGNAQVGPVTTVDASGDGRAHWSPSTWTPMTSCKPGYVLSGILAHEGVAGKLFLDVTITCSHLLLGGNTGETQTIKVTGSLTDSNMPSQAQCMTGEVVNQLGPWTGAGLDAVNVYCAPASCASS
jgi:hypothetical protein